MSSVLYRLGRWCAAHAWRTLALWLVVLIGVGTLAATVGKPLTSQISIPGTEFEKVLDRLGGEIPEAAGGAGTVVLESGDEPFTEAQQAAVEDVFASWAEVPHVKRVTNPFEAQAQLDQSAADIAAAATTIEDGQRELDAGRATLGEGELQLSGGEALLDQLVAANPDDPTIPGLREQLESGRAELEKGRAELEQGEADLAAGRAQYDDGKAVADATAGTRLVSEDGRYAVVQVQFDDNAQSVPVTDRALIPERGDTALADAGVTAHYSVEITQDTSLIGPGEVIGLTVALVVLVVVLGSLIAAGLPLLVALLGVGVGLAGAVAFTVFTDLNTMTPSLALMLAWPWASTTRSSSSTGTGPASCAATTCTSRSRARWRPPGARSCSPARRSSSPSPRSCCQASRSSPRWAWSPLRPWPSPWSSPSRSALRSSPS